MSTFNLFTYNNPDFDKPRTPCYMTKREIEEIKNAFHRDKLIYEEKNKCLMSEEKKQIKPQKQTETQKIINEVYAKVQNRCTLSDNINELNIFYHRIKFVYQYTIKNYNRYKAKYEIVAFASLLCKLPSLTNEINGEERNRIIIKLVEELLGNYNLDKNSLDSIKDCLLNYENNRFRTPEEICIKDANIIPVFYNIPTLFKIAYVDYNMEIEEGCKFVENKIDNSYNSLSEEGKNGIFDEYKRAKVLLMQSK